MQRWADSELGRAVIAGSGFLADGYDLYIIGGVVEVLTQEFSCAHSHRHDCLLPGEMKYYRSTISSAALFGAIFGQVIFGSLADRLGRRAIFIATGALIIAGALSSSLVQEVGHGPRCLLVQLALCRGLLGFGIGGEYPLSATICAEGTSARRRGTLLVVVLANQGLGYLLSALVMVALAYSGVTLEFRWRFALAFGAVVPILSMYFRTLMTEGDAFERVLQARECGDRSVGFQRTVRRYYWHMAGTAGNWFLFDIIFYANGLFNADVVRILGLPGDELRESALSMLLVVLIMLPGYFASALFINAIGRKGVQLQGYLFLAGCFAVCAFAYERMRKQAPCLLLATYGMTFFFSNFGPGLTSYLIPGEIYPTQAKATLHGVSAAAGKLGAFVGASLMPIVTGSPATPSGVQRAMLLCSQIAVVGFFWTVFFTPSYDPEDLEAKDYGETVGFVPLPFQPMKRKQRD